MPRERRFIPTVVHMAHNVYYVNKRRTRGPSSGLIVTAAPLGLGRPPTAALLLETGRTLTRAPTAP